MAGSVVANGQIHTQMSISHVRGSMRIISSAGYTCTVLTLIIRTANNNY